MQNNFETKSEIMKTKTMGLMAITALKKSCLKIKTIAFLLLIGTVSVHAQDVDINIIPQESGMVDGSWAQDAPAGSTAILVTVCNNDGGSTAVPSYKLRPLISVPGSIVQFAATASQTGLPAGWSILSNSGSSIRLSNGTDQIAAAECRDIILYVTPVAQGGPLTVTATMSFSDGVAPGSAVGPQTVGNNTANDNSTTTVQITAPQGPLPVTLVSFKAGRELQTALLTWITTKETNLDRYEIQRSSNGKEWAGIGVIPSHHESDVLVTTYHFTDEKPLKGDNLYRLAMVDLDGSFAYSPIEDVNFAIAGEDVSVYPNPVSDKLMIRNVEQISQVSISDQAGRTVYETELLSNKGIDVHTLTPGIYAIKLSHKDGTVSTQKIVIAK